MPYPPAPWTLKGAALVTLTLSDSKRARPLIPEPLKIMPVRPGKTLGIVYFADYGTDSDLVYHELIIAPALVRLGRKVGFWISHIYVDNPDSAAGGREVWGLPKELARFVWDFPGGRVEAWQDELLLCAYQASPSGMEIPAPFFLPTISVLDGQVLAFRGDVTCQLGLTQASVEIPAGSPFAGMGLEGSSTGFHLQHMTFRAGEPAVIGQSREAAAHSGA